MQLKIALAQMSLSKDIQENTVKIIDFIAKCDTTDVLVFPEGAISGYNPEDESFISNMDVNKIESAVESISLAVKKRRIEVIAGSAYFTDNAWYNCTFWFNSDGTIKYIYKKCNLSNLDRNHFVAGNELKTMDLMEIPVGIQMCREVLYPEQWLVLRIKGAEVIFHITNSSNKISQWLSVYRTRAYENHVFVISSNALHKDQELGSYIIGPMGEIELQTEKNKEGLYYHTINVEPGIPIGITQRRTDLVDLKYN